ncbi:hypothetical protein, partial [Methylovulum psychrotolerans]|uniref:hypothetical protein n=1 Tax=Methylovulum psychrotolerans TaxID=1704499 RepID=UPI001B804D4D
MGKNLSGSNAQYGSSESFYSIIKFFIKPALNRVGNLLKTQMYRVRLLPPLMGRVGVGRIKS